MSGYANIFYYYSVISLSHIVDYFFINELISISMNYLKLHNPPYLPPGCGFFLPNLW